MKEIIKKAKDFLVPERGEAYLNSWQKRTVDVLGTILISPAILPPMGAAAALIKLEDGGDVFFTQERMGKNRKPFKLYKLRTMTPGQNSQETSYTYPKLPENPRVTRVGKLLRRWCIDEIPQFINILKGEMSLIGVRPLPVAQFEAYQRLPNVQDLAESWAQLYSLSRPGWTSLTSVSGRALLDLNQAGIRRKLRYDQFYVTHASFCLDLFILKEGVKAFFSGEGAW